MASQSRGASAASSPMPIKSIGCVAVVTRPTSRSATGATGGWGSVAEDAADPGPRAERTKAYGDGEVTLQDDRGLCVHTGFCGNKITNAWKLAARQDLDAAGATQLVAMTQHCPSGAISITVGEGDLEPALPTEVVLIPNGPLWVTGGVTVERSDGVPLETRNRVTLCRCGASKTKPLCDGSHAGNAFRHAPTAEA